MEKEILEGNKLIAEFMGKKIIEIDYEKNIRVECLIPLHYHTSWDWQVPAWSKIAKLIKKIADDGNEFDYKIYMGLIGRYENAVFNNIPMEGLVVITDAISWYNSNKKL